MSDQILIISAIVIALSLILFDWRNGAVISIIIGFVQDPIRKIVPDQPIYFTVIVLAAIALMIVIALSKFGSIRLSPVFGFNKAIANRVWLFVGLVFIQSIITFLKTGSYTLPIIGILAYCLPFIVMWLGYNYYRGFGDFDRLVTVYIVCCIIAATGLFLSWQKFDWEILKSVGEGLLITDSNVSGGVLESHSGFLRSPEIAAWHMGTATCAVLLMALFRNDRRWSSWTLVLIPVFLMAGLLTGRRKMIVGVIAFIVIFLVLSIVFKEKRGQTRIFSLFGLFSVFLSTIQLGAESSLQDYFVRGSNSFDGFDNRLQDLGLLTIWYAVQVGGFFGLGAGIASQGSQYFISDIQNGAAEGGMGKITLELGIPGLFLMLWLIWGMGQYLWQLLQNIGNTAPEKLSLFLGITAFLLSNMASYAIASQAFGDPFILIIIGNCLSFLLVAPRLIDGTGQLRREM